MARPVKNISALQGHRSKEEIEQRLASEEAIRGDCDNIQVPDFIANDDVAVAEFNRMVEELSKVNLATNVDTTLLGVYADSYSKYSECSLCLSNEPLVIETESKNGQITPVINPYVKIQQQYSAILLKISTLYGLDPSSRSKIAHLTPTDKKDEVDPLLDLLSKVKK